VSAQQSGTPQLSVVVPTYNRAPLLRRTLASLVQQRNPPPFEVIVADDGSADDSEQVVAAFRDQLASRYAYQEDRGFRVARARNMGAALARAPILVFLDSGTLAGPDLLVGHLRCHSEHRPAPRSPACGAAVIGYTYGYDLYQSAPGPAEALARMTPQQMYERYHADRSFRDSRHEELARAGFDLSRLRLPWMFFWSMNVSVHAGDYAAVGGFDEWFRSWGAEDVELGYRLHRRGVPFVADVRPWAVEYPHPRDADASMASARRNVLHIVTTHADPAVELFWALFTREGNMWPAEDAYRSLLEWADHVAALDVQPEVDCGTADLPAGARVAVFGSGASVPGRGLRGTLVDFDARLLGRARADGRLTTRLGLGIRTPLPDRAFDRVLITSRLARLWPEWGQAILAEAARIGASVQGPPANELGQGRLHGDRLHLAYERLDLSQREVVRVRPDLQVDRGQPLRESLPADHRGPGVDLEEERAVEHGLLAIPVQPGARQDPRHLRLGGHVAVTAVRAELAAAVVEAPGDVERLSPPGGDLVEQPVALHRVVIAVEGPVRRRLLRPGHHLVEGGARGVDHAYPVLGDL
jgi:glycosyltransferase involved in cell wall biosynthesis